MSESSSQSIALNARLDDYFREPVVEALRDSSVTASGATEAYLIQMLSDYAKPTTDSSALSESVTLLYHEAMKTAGHERFRKLQSLGDGVLYSMGFFHGTLARNADAGYVASVGKNAYGHAARMLRTGQGVARGPDVLEELSSNFERFISVLRYVSDWVYAKSHCDEEGLLRMYERWRRTGSTVLRNELSQRGLVPSEAPGGIH